MKGIIIYGMLLLTSVLVFSCEQKQTNASIPALSETYKKNDDKPFGGSVAYKLLQQLYPDNMARVKKESFDETWKGIYDTAAIQVLIARSLYTSDEDVESILDYVKSGNDLVLASAIFDDNLANKIGFSVDWGDEYQNIAKDVMNTTAVSFAPNVIDTKDQYQYYYRPFCNYFSSLPKENMRILGYNSKGQPNSFVYFHGKGRLFLHCEPRAFSNYFLLQKDNYKYLQNLMSLAIKDPQHLYWNEFYVNIKRPRSSGSGSDSGSGSNSSGSSFREVLKSPGLSAAFWLILILLLLYIIYGMKRKQRIIEKIKPNENTSVSFTETVGRLYLQKKDNKNVADKMVTYFNEFVRNQYFLNTNHVNEEFITTLGRKSGIAKDQVESLYRAINHTQVSTEIDDYQLLSLNQQIQNFYKNKT